MWDVTVGGSAIIGENSRQAATREVAEELGLKIDLENIPPVITKYFSEGFDDIYILEKTKKEEINNNILKEAIINKFEERKNSNLVSNIYLKVLNLEKNIKLKELWNEYRNKFTYAKDIEFEDTIKSLKNIVSVFNIQNQSKKFIKVTKKENLKEQEQESDDELEL